MQLQTLLGMQSGWRMIMQTHLGTVCSVGLWQTMLAAAKLAPEDYGLVVGEVMPAFIMAIRSTLNKHATRWLQAPLVLCLGASTRHSSTFRRSWLSLRGEKDRPKPINSE
eukprot:scpid97535/ scgid6788/ 